MPRGTRGLWFALMLGLAPACWMAGEPRQIAPDAAPEPVTDLDLVGSYWTDERWDLSEPLDSHPELGDAVADLTVDILVAQIGLPDSLDAAAELVLTALVGGTISNFVNSTFPTELGPGAGFIASLREVMGEVEVHATMTLTTLDLNGRDDNPNFYTGLEAMVPVILRNGETQIEVGVELGDPDTAPETWGNVLNASRVLVGTHRRLPYGALVAASASQLLGVEDVRAYAAETAAALDCQGLADAIADIQSTVDDFGDATQDVEDWLGRAAEVVLVGCADLENQVGELVVPLLDAEMRITRSCSSPLIDEDGDKRVDRFEPEPGVEPNVLYSIVDVSTNSRFVDIEFSAMRTADVDE